MKLYFSLRLTLFNIFIFRACFLNKGLGLFFTWPFLFALVILPTLGREIIVWVSKTALGICIFYSQSKCLQIYKNRSFEIKLKWKYEWSTRRVGIRALFCNICLCFGQSRATVEPSLSLSQNTPIGWYTYCFTLAWPHFWRTQLHSPPNGDFCPRIWAS